MLFTEAVSWVSHLNQLTFNLRTPHCHGAGRKASRALPLGASSSTGQAVIVLQGGCPQAWELPMGKHAQRNHISSLSLSYVTFSTLLYVLYLKEHESIEDVENQCYWCSSKSFRATEYRDCHSDGGKHMPNSPSPPPTASHFLYLSISFHTSAQALRSPCLDP